ncbi:hypothetical protein [Streptomyces sp. R41]|uniref:Uncharacterized protein n=1 Tax=Streptomyces sp. R41 TaxID=3238632 RepID=A0AB39R5U2_9ACTN
MSPMRLWLALIVKQVVEPGTDEVGDYSSDWLKAAAVLESVALHEPLENKNLFFACWSPTCS